MDNVVVRISEYLSKRFWYFTCQAETANFQFRNGGGSNVFLASKISKSLINPGNRQILRTSQTPSVLVTIHSFIRLFSQNHVNGTRGICTLNITYIYTKSEWAELAHFAYGEQISFVMKIHIFFFKLKKWSGKKMSVRHSVNVSATDLYIYNTWSTRNN